MNWYKKAQVEPLSWTPEERDFLEGVLEKLSELQKNNANAKIQVDGTITGSQANFVMNSNYAVSTQVGTKWEKSRDSINIEKTDDNYYAVSINEGKWKDIDNFETFKVIVDNFYR